VKNRCDRETGWGASPDSSDSAEAALKPYHESIVELLKSGELSHVEILGLSKLARVTRIPDGKGHAIASAFFDALVDAPSVDLPAHVQETATILRGQST